VIRSADISADGLYRYTLRREWASGPTMTFIMLNPSTADADIDDPTIRRCIGFANREGCGTLHVVNLFGFRSTKPNGLLNAVDPKGPENTRYVKDAVDRSTFTVAAWGNWWLACRHRPPRFNVEGYAGRTGKHLLCLGTTASGQPRHPLYVKGDAPLVQWIP
jgi:hypothetical protein